MDTRTSRPAGRAAMRSARSAGKAIPAGVLALVLAVLPIAFHAGGPVVYRAAAAEQESFADQVRRSIAGDRVATREACKAIGVRGPLTFDSASALRPLLRAEAMRGSSACANAYALMLQFGIGGSKDTREAPEWYARGASTGNRTATNNAALAYALGWGVRRDTQRAVSLLDAVDAPARAAEMLRISDALMAPGREEPEEARKWAARAADLATPDQTRAAQRFERLGPLDEAEAARLRAWYAAGVARAEPEAVKNLARLLAGGNAEDRAAAANLLLTGVEAGDEDAAAMLVLMLQEDRASYADDGPVVTGLKAMAEAGSLTARKVLAQVYSTWGITDPKVRTEGMRHLEMAARAGDAEAQYRLALVLLNGTDGGRRMELARAYLSLAAESGHAGASDAASRLGPLPPAEARSILESRASAS